MNLVQKYLEVYWNSTQIIYRYMGVAMGGPGPPKFSLGPPKNLA